MTRITHLLLEFPSALAWNLESGGPVELSCEQKHCKLAWCRLQLCNEDPLRALYRARIPAARNYDVCNKLHTRPAQGVFRGAKKPNKSDNSKTKIDEQSYRYIRGRQFLESVGMYRGTTRKHKSKQRKGKRSIPANLTPKKNGISPGSDARYDDLDTKSRMLSHPPKPDSPEHPLLIRSIGP